MGYLTTEKKVDIRSCIQNMVIREEEARRRREDGKLETSTSRGANSSEFAQKRDQGNKSISITKDDEENEEQGVRNKSINSVPDLNENSRSISRKYARKKRQTEVFDTSAGNQSTNELKSDKTIHKNHRDFDLDKEKAVKLRKLRQTHIDVGQRNFGSIMCPYCGMIYTAGMKEDEILHERLHRRLGKGYGSKIDSNCFGTTTPILSTSNGEKVLKSYETSKIIQITSYDPLQQRQKVRKGYH